MKWTQNRNSILWPYLLILVAAVLRLTVSQPFNSIPVFSCILFFGASRPKREFPIPFLALVGTDIFLTTHRYGFALSSDHAVTWIWYLAVMLLGAAVLGTFVSIPRVMGASLLASVSFFLASNFAVWAAWGLYPKTLSGLAACYIAALPFFRNSVVSETAFSLLIFAVARYSELLMPATCMRRPCS